MAFHGGLTASLISFIHSFYGQPLFAFFHIFDITQFGTKFNRRHPTNNLKEMATTVYTVRRWRCDVCHVAHFATFEEACRHEEECCTNGNDILRQQERVPTNNHDNVIDLMSSSSDDYNHNDDNSFIEMNVDDNNDSGSSDGSSSSDDEGLLDFDDDVDDDELNEDDTEVINQGGRSEGGGGGSAAAVAAAAAEPTARPRRQAATSNSIPTRLYLEDSDDDDDLFIDDESTPAASPPNNILPSTRRNVELPPMDDTLIRKLCNEKEGGSYGGVLVVEDFFCPILLDLPTDPVVAADGRIYERSAIEQHFQKSGPKSPWTNLPMSSATLHDVPAIFFTTLETKISNGQFKGDAADAWMEKRKETKNKMKEYEKFKELLLQAEAGNVQAMEHVADCYQTGEYGVTIDQYEAFKWFDRANNAGSVIGKGNVGELLVTGSGVKKNVLKGQRELFTAMLQGSDYAAYALGMDYANGNNGLPKDRQLAIQLLQRCLNETESKHRNMDDEETATAREILKELPTGRG